LTAKKRRRKRRRESERTRCNAREKEHLDSPPGLTPTSTQGGARISRIGLGLTH